MTRREGGARELREGGIKAQKKFVFLFAVQHLTQCGERGWPLRS